LVVDPDAVLPLPIALQGFEPVSGQRGNIPDRSRRFELIQFHLRLARSPKTTLQLAFGNARALDEAHSRGRSA
jgi:hypothetical protein